MIRLFQGLLVLCLSAAAFAGEEFDRTMTAFTAMTLNQIKTLADLQKFDLGASNSKILKDELVKNGKAPFAPKKIEQTGATIIKMQFARSAVVLDLKEISSGIIYVNDRQVKMDNKKTYFNYKAEVDAILAMKKKDAFLRLILSEAVAAEEDPGSYVSWGLTRIQRALGARQSPESLRSAAVFDADLETEILGAYRAAAGESTVSQTGETSMFTSKFECDGTRLKSVSLVTFRSDGAQDGFTASMTELLNGGWRLFDPYMGGESATTVASSDGTVLKNGTRSGRNIFAEAPFYEFPKVAKRCCKKIGCYAKVSRGLATIVRTRLSAPAPSSGAQ